MRETSPDNEPSLQEGEFALTEWLLFRGHRLLIAGLVLGLIWALSILLIQFNVLEVGPSSSMPTLLGGIIAGQLTLFTVTLSINQLILSRMFASPPEIKRRLRGTVNFRQQVRDVTDDPRPPVNPQEFLAVIARALHARSEELVESADTVDPKHHEAIEECALSLQNYSKFIETLAKDERTETLYIVSALSHETYVQNTVAVEQLRADLSSLPERISAILEDVSTILEAVPVARQHFKTLTIQQQLAGLSRYIVYTGIPSILISILLLLFYTSGGGVKVPELYIRPIAALTIPIIMTPSVLLGVYVLPLAVVAERTVSTGPFLLAE
ncbi:hypothetical protein [Halomicrococcus sp. NG-SE-24]|uniref:hypothetical protein n=1 Tax=Halomicrococcus sp. NG-SE-24 TaxID=3436928 RepID=UPI003D960936